MREQDYIKETASAGATGSGSIAVTTAVPNKKKKTPMIKRESYNNVQVKGSDPKPKAKPGRTDHPFKGKLVGEQEKELQKIREGVLDTQDDDGWMAKSELYKAAKYAAELHQMISDTDNLEPWVAAKITKAADYLSSVKHYMEYNSLNPVMGDMESSEVVQ